MPRSINCETYKNVTKRKLQDNQFSLADLYAHYMAEKMAAVLTEGSQNTLPTILRKKKYEKESTLMPIISDFRVHFP